MITIGLDVGASKVCGWAITINEQGLAKFGEIHLERKYTDHVEYPSGFMAIPIELQFQEKKAANIKLTDPEKRLGIIWVETAFEVIRFITSKKERQDVLLGIGIPGLKTRDGRGINIINNGPRIPNYLDQLEHLLLKHQINLARPVERLGSDSDYCGIGENFSKNGLFRDVDNAYYIGGGSGVTEALKLNGKVTGFDEVSSWMAKAWELVASSGMTFEQIISAKSIALRYAHLKGISHHDIEKKNLNALFIAESTICGDKTGQTVFDEVTTALAEILFERIQTIGVGSSGMFQFDNPAHLPLKSAHPYVGFFLERIVIGQRLGNLWREDRFHPLLKCPTEKKLSIMLQDNLTISFQNNYLNNNGNLKQDILFASQLREAPVLGAAIDAYHHYKS